MGTEPWNITPEKYAAAVRQAFESGMPVSDPDLSPVRGTPIDELLAPTRMIIQSAESRRRIATELLAGPGEWQIQLLWSSGGPHSGRLVCDLCVRGTSIEFTIVGLEQSSDEPIESQPPRGRELLSAMREVIRTVFGSDTLLRVPGA